MIFLFRTILLALLLTVVAVPEVQAQNAADDPVARIGAAESELRAVDARLDRAPDDEEQTALRARADAAGKIGTAAVAELEEKLALVDARIQELGPAAAGGDAPEIVRQRRALTAEHTAVDAAIRRGRLIAVDARQLVGELDRSRSEKLGAMLSERVASPIAPAFWEGVIRAAPRDFRRISLFVRQGTDQVRAQWRGGLPWQALLGAGLALLILFPLRLAVTQLVRRYLIEDTRGHRVRRSVNAIQRIIVGTAAPTLAAIALVSGMRWAGLLPDRWNALLDAFIGGAGFGAFVIAVTGALLMARQPSWRIAPIADEAARQLRRLSWPLGLIAGVAIIVDTFNTSVGASHAAIVATQGVEAMLRLALLIAALVTLGRLRAAREDAAAGDPDAAVASPALSLVTLIAWIVAAVAFVALLLGYVGLSAFVLQLASWAVVVGSAVYLLARAVDDIATTVFNRDSGFGRAVTRATGIGPSMVDQFGLILAGVLRLTVYLIGLVLLFSPFGAGGIASLFGRLGTFAQGVQVGGVAISPGAILRGVIVLGIGLALLRAFMRWLDEKYLPATELDGSSRDSISLVTRYVGVALATIWALASLGIGVERIALLLSALSVGIGFGLQAITQNFVSGLILLAERPIKIGDLVRVGADEGDVKRINVRSTEIALADHSTLIVPNSELITKTVLNKTRASPLGRVQIQFSVPLDVDVRVVRAIVLETFAAEDAVLDDPVPSVFVDSITNDRVMFNCFAHTSTPRNAYGARSSVLMTLLGRFHDEGIDIGSPPQRFEFAGGARARDDADPLLPPNPRS